jgi:hypothetical protein
MNIKGLPTILYIMGTGRSATTILEILIANNPEVSGVGEITHIFRDAVINNNRCSCGSIVDSCPLWSTVLKNKMFVEKYQRKTYCKSLFYRFDWHYGFIKQVFGLFKKLEKKAYQEINSLLFQTASQFYGCKILVDSSKYAARAIALHKAFPGKVKVICLTRSPNGLVKAFRRIDAEEQRPKNLFAIVLYYLFVLSCCRIALFIIGKPNCIVISYEELMRDNISVFDQIEKLSDISLSSIKEKVLNNEYLDIHHIMTGNRLRKKGKIKFMPNPSIYKPKTFMEKTAIKFMNLFGRMLGFKY